MRPINFTEMPTALIIFYFISSFFIAFIAGTMVVILGRKFLTIADKVSPFSWTWDGWFFLFIIFSLLGITWFFKEMAKHSSIVLSEKIFTSKK